MTSANERQVGGDHYKKAAYQHWDFVTDVGMKYLPGCATKYVARWRDKAGLQDLEKAQHYLDKCAERKVAHPLETRQNEAALRLFMAQLPAVEADVVRLVTHGEYEKARDLVTGLIELNYDFTPIRAV